MEPERDYSYASYHYGRDPGLINVLPAQGIEVVRDAGGQALDGVEVVARHLGTIGGGAEPKMGRYRLLSPLPASVFGQPEVQPWRGVPGSSTAASTGGGLGSVRAATGSEGAKP